MAANVTSTDKKGKLSKTSPKTPEEIMQGFNQLRYEQRQLASKTTELQMDLNEHKLVIETLNEVDAARKCYRLVGGILVERTVKEVLPALTNNLEQLIKVTEALNEQVMSKGKEINDYRDKYNIQVRGQDSSSSDSTSKTDTSKTSSGSTGVLVDSKS